MSSEEQRECGVCHELKPATQEFFSFRTFAKTGYGPERQCKACKAARERERKAALREDPETKAKWAEERRQMRERRGEEMRAKEAEYAREHRRRKREE